jgi:hypothetical protein
VELPFTRYSSGSYERERQGDDHFRSHSYFVNIFGVIQYKTVHEEIAKRFFEAFFKKDIFVGQLWTRLGIVGWEQKGPEEAAQALLEMISQKDE